jgi:AcrR family transcriptional regulator
MTENIEVPGMRKKILETAARLFVVGGYDGVSMREIAEACGMSKAGLYYHFQDKERLFFEILKENLDELEKVIQEAAQQAGGAREKVSYFVRAVFLHLPAEQNAIIRLANQEMTRVSPAAREAFNERYWTRFIGPLAGFFGEGIRTGEFRTMDPHLAVWGLLGVMYPFFNPEHYKQARSPEKVVEFILAIYFEGINAHD